MLYARLDTGTLLHSQESPQTDISYAVVEQLAGCTHRRGLVEELAEAIGEVADEAVGVA